MVRGFWVLSILLAACANGSGEDVVPNDASISTPSCDPLADPCPPDQHCSPLLRRCIPGCHADPGCNKGRCDVENHECVGCLGSGDCRPEEVCAGDICVPGCTPDRACPEGLTCCAGACVDNDSNVDHCGGCGKKCTTANGSPACWSSKCVIASCKTPFEDCDGDPQSGCESDTTTNTNHCGGCGKKCSPAHASGSCALGVCSIGSCASGFADCNANPTDGCEVDTTRDPNNCGGCGKKPAETCNLRDDNCNGACDDLDGCRVAVHRSNGTHHFYTTSASEAACCGFTVENYNYFYLYVDGGADRAPFYRCYNPTVGRHFYTTSSTCETWGADKVEGVMGQIGTTATCGAVPLYRLYKSTSGHLFTTDPAERTSAISAGWTDEGVKGYVWKAPRG